MKTMVIGLGNIGSALARLVAPLSGAGDELVLVDGDVFDPGNLISQLIDREDVGRNKAVALARKIRGANAKLKVSTFPSRLENVPLGVFADCDVVISCLDSKAARVAVNERVWRAGVSFWIDTGVAADGRLARVTLYRPGIDAPCLECGWGGPEYASLEVNHPCGGVASPKTEAPAALGCLAASLAVLEFEKLLSGGGDAVRWNAEIITSAATQTQHISKLKRDAKCRFDHRTLAAESAGVNVRDTTLGDLWDRFGSRDVLMRVEGGRWLTSVMCGSCRASLPALAVRGRGLVETEFCPSCGSGRLIPSGFHQKDLISRADVSDAQFALQLCRLGIRPREIVSFIRPDHSTRSLLLS